MTPDDFLAWITPSAKRMCAAYDLPYQVCVAQGAIESEWGEYGIGKGGNNIFGRKWGGNGSYVTKLTEEVVGGETVQVYARFQEYDSIDDAIEDWCYLITEEPCYASCLAVRNDIEQFVRTLAPIYATDPEYADKILETIGACFSDET
ncbi:MAG: glucosaminidase domain-containing protein [Negativicutes bacterium]|nr:glucosaminidase domain-containing protein [Negativicutes bacterium]MDR3593080.1 glucosaminidase domain-containing protein [Negativicutes bacterium]